MGSEKIRIGDRGTGPTNFICKKIVLGIPYVNDPSIIFNIKKKLVWYLAVTYSIFFKSQP